MVSLLNELRNYKSTNPDKITAKKITLINAKKLYNNRNNVIKAFENRVFPLRMDFKKKSQLCPIRNYQIGLKSKKKRFDRIQNKVQNAKNNNLQARPFGNFINFIESNKLIHEIAYHTITMKKR